MEDGRSISEFILGNARALESISKEELFAAKKTQFPCLRIWCECFVKTLIQHGMKMEDLIIAYRLFKTGEDKSHIQALDILPDNLKRNKRLACKYIEGLAYATFKRDLEKLIHYHCITEAMPKSKAAQKHKETTHV